MKLTGYTAHRTSVGLFDVHMPLDDLSVLLGANDAGKSTLLRALDEDLRGGAELGESTDGEGGAIFVELTDAELALLLPHRDSSGRAPEVPRWDFRDYGYRLGDAVTEPTPEAYAAALAKAAVEAPASFATVLKALQASHIVCLEPTRTAARRHVGFDAHWCLPPLAELATDVVDALRESQLLRFSRERSKAASQGSCRLPFRMGPSAHLLIDAAPVLVAPLLWRGDPRAPRPLSAPASFPDVVEAISESVSNLVEAARFGVQDVVRDESRDAEDEAQRAAPRVLLKRTDDSGGWRIDPVASGALRIIEAEATRLLPAFVTDRYTLGVSFRDVDEWFVEHPIRVELTPIVSSGYTRAFDVDHCADGFRLWLQLALIGAVEELTVVTAQLHPVFAGVVEYVGGQDEAVAHASDGDAEQPVGLSPDSVLTGARQAIAGFEGGTIQDSQELSDLRTYAYANGYRRDIAGPARVLIVDEPERRLHPRLGRHAAGWLARVVRESAATVVAASHATQFLALAEEVRIVLVQRVNGRVTATPMSSSDADTLSKVRDVLGLEQGELLMTYGCMLLVEGEHDKVALEGVFGPELRSAGVLVLPVRGSARAGLFDSEILWRLTTAPTLMMSDNLKPEIVCLAEKDPEECLCQTARSDVAEERALHAALKAGRTVGKELVFMGHPEKDLILALDEEVIRSIYSAYPGHETALAAFERERGAATGKRPGIKPTFEKLYKIPNHASTYEKLAVAHADAHARPPALKAVVDRAVELARGFRSDATRQVVSSVIT